MARLARIVVAGRAHHVTQRGNRPEPVFFEEGDQSIYLDLLREQTEKHDVKVWAYCLMPNHVHLILVPGHVEGMSLVIGKTHRHYTNFVNVRGRWTGHLFQSRFASVLLDDDHFVCAIRYVSLNPVHARLVSTAEQWPWSSVRAHLAAKDDALIRVRPVLDRIPHLRLLLGTAMEDDFTDLRRAEATGRPLANAEYITQLEQLLGRAIARRAPGRKPTSQSNDNRQLELSID